MENLGLNDIKTTYQNDYGGFDIKKCTPPQINLYDPLDHVPPLKPPTFVDITTMYKFRDDVYVPFDLMFRPKDCVNTNPHKRVPIRKLAEEIFEEKLKMRKIRPRVHRFPQICLDDVPEDIMYGKNGLAENIYTSDWKKSSELVQTAMKGESKSKDKQMENVHMIDIEKKMESIRIKKFYDYTPMDVGYLKYVKDWDKFQPRAIVDKNPAFWKRNKDKGLCSICEGLEANINLSAAEKAEIQSSLQDEQLRSTYTLLPPGYGGYVPKLPVGIPVRKKLFARHEPFITTLMEDQGVYLKPQKPGEV